MAPLIATAEALSLSSPTIEDRAVRATLACVARHGLAKTTFDDKCASCHGKDGRGKTFKGKLSHARDLTSGEWQNDVSDERLFNSISNGRNKMPAFKKKLSEAQIDELVAYVRRFRR